jgi:hypothetical protein
MNRTPTLMVALALAAAASAQRTPIATTGYNFDGIANGTSAATSTTGTLDSIYDYYTVGFNTGSPTSGLPTASFVSAADATTTFQLQSPASNNVLWLQQAGSGATSGTLNLSTPGSYSSLAFLLTGFNGSQPGTYSLNFSSGLPTTGSFTALDNFNQAGFAISGFGRVSRSDGLFDAVGSTNPRLYQVTVTLTSGDAARTLTSITFNNAETSGTVFHDIGVFGVSGAPVPEPASMVVLGAGALALLRRRKK